MEKRIRSSQIVILTAVTSLLFACLVTSPVIFVTAESKNGDPAANASVLAERHLDRAMEELRRTGRCPAEGRTVSCDDSLGESYDLDTKVVRSESGDPRRVSVRVRWNGPLGGGAVVATGICECYGGKAIAAVGNPAAGVNPSGAGDADIREAR